MNALDLCKNIERIHFGQHMPREEFHFDQALIDKVLLGQKSLRCLQIWTALSKLKNLCGFLDRGLFMISAPGLEQLRIELSIDCDTPVDAHDVMYHVTRVAQRLLLSHVRDFWLVLRLRVCFGYRVTTHQVDKERMRKSWLDYESIEAASNLEMHFDLGSLTFVITNRDCAIPNSPGPFRFDTGLIDQLL